MGNNMAVSYIGEHLWVGQIGHFFIILGFVAALLSTFSYFRASSVHTVNDQSSWLLLGKGSFYLHGISVAIFMLVIFFAMYHHYYEYSYVFDHVSPDLPLKYILSAFWEGQEGSFMLWMFWHIVLGFILIYKADQWQAPVMMVIALAEAILMTMILGIQIPFGEDAIRIGSNPTTLLRQINDAPIFANADYLSLIKGRGMNPLLQNYWMTIHPPTLFLGFASTIVPFGYAFAGLWTNQHKEWLKPTLTWSLFSAGILGTGILMGSLWAYVALSFGGYWAWDPVENASLVPWITLVAGIHVHLVARSTGYATRSVYFFYLISFVLVLYSTFLTRSGILGDTSAHSFTEMGLEWQLLFLVLTFLLGGQGLLLFRLKDIKSPKQEEALPSREFWMFIGALVLLFSSILISSSTSLPVFNKIMTYFDPGYEGRVIKDVIGHYNKYQLWIAVFVAVLSGFTIFLRYGSASWDMQKTKFFRTILTSIALAAIFTYLFTLWLDYQSWQYAMMGFAGFFGIFTQIDYIVRVTKGNFRLAWSAFSHFGFATMMIGLIASGLNQKAISTNPFVFKNMFSDEDVKKYVQLFKNEPMYSQGYIITYLADTLIDKERKYTLNFKKLDESQKVIEELDLYPNAVYSNDFTKVAAFNPDTKHYLNKDIFACIVSLPPALSNAEEAQKIEDSINFINYSLPLNDTLHLSRYDIQCENISYQPTKQEYLKHQHDAGFSAHLIIKDNEADTIYKTEIAVGMEGALMYNYPATIEAAGLKLKLSDSTNINLFSDDSKLAYQEFTFKNEGFIQFDDFKIHLKGFDRSPIHPNYTAEENDIALGAKLEIVGKESKEEANSIYIIRDNTPMSIKSYSPISGLHIRFSNIDPKTEEFSFKIAKDKRSINHIDLSVAQDVPRTDYVILQATVFPGINLFWAGCIIMMLGLFLAAWDRYSKQRS